mgnify:FL=1
MSNTRKYSEHIGPSKDSNWDGIEKGKDNLSNLKKEFECQEHLEVEPIHCKVPGVKSLGEILQSDFKNLFERRTNND